MYFISEGEVEVWGPPSASASSSSSDAPPPPAPVSHEAGIKLIATLGVRAFFGEMALLTQRGIALASVKAKGFAVTYHLSTTEYAKMLELYPRFRTYVREIAKLRLKGQEAKPLAKKLRKKVLRRGGMHSARSSVFHKAREFSLGLIQDITGSRARRSMAGRDWRDSAGSGTSDDTAPGPAPSATRKSALRRSQTSDTIPHIRALGQEKRCNRWSEMGPRRV